MEFITKIDTGILKLFFTIGEKTGEFFTPIAKAMTFLGEKGWVFLVISVGLAIFPKTRKVGVCLFGSIACCFLVSNLILRDWIARPRPFQASEEILQWWYQAGHVFEKGYSCPSGHVSSAMGGVTAFWFFRKRDKKSSKYLLLLYIWPALMFLSRCHLMAHYPSDCLFGLLVGWCSAYAAWYVTEVIYILMNNHKNGPFASFALNDNMVVALVRWIKKLRAKKKETTETPEKQVENAKIE